MQVWLIRWNFWCSACHHPDSVRQDESDSLSQVRWKWNLRDRRGSCCRTRHFLKAKVLHAERTGHRNCTGSDSMCHAFKIKHLSQSQLEKLQELILRKSSFNLLAQTI